MTDHLTAAADEIRREIVAAAQAADPTGQPSPGLAPHIQDARAALLAISARRAAAEQIRVEAMMDLMAWIPACRLARLTVQEIADLAGVGRSAVYKALD